jgi:hypothetical protein
MDILMNLQNIFCLIYLIFGSSTLFAWESDPLLTQKTGVYGQVQKIEGFEPVGDCAYEALKPLILAESRVTYVSFSKLEAFPKEIWHIIWSHLNNAAKQNLGRVTKATHQNILQGMHLMNNSQRLKGWITYEFDHYSSDRDFHLDQKFKSILKYTQILESLSQNALEPSIRNKANNEFNKIIQADKNDVQNFLNRYKSIHKDFKTITTQKYEKNYIYLSKTYNTNYEENCCCLICWNNSYDSCGYTAPHGIDECMKLHTCLCCPCIALWLCIFVCGTSCK